MLYQTPDYLEEVALIEASRIQREAMAFKPTSPDNPTENEDD